MMKKLLLVTMILILTATIACAGSYDDKTDRLSQGSGYVFSPGYINAATQRARVIKSTAESEEPLDRSLEKADSKLENAVAENANNKIEPVLQEKRGGGQSSSNQNVSDAGEIITLPSDGNTNLADPEVLKQIYQDLEAHKAEGYNAYDVTVKVFKNGNIISLWDESDNDIAGNFYFRLYNSSGDTIVERGFAGSTYRAIASLAPIEEEDGSFIFRGYINNTVNNNITNPNNIQSIHTYLRIFDSAGTLKTVRDFYSNIKYDPKNPLSFSGTGQILEDVKCFGNGRIGLQITDYNTSTRNIALADYNGNIITNTSSPVTNLAGIDSLGDGRYITRTFNYPSNTTNFVVLDENLNSLSQFQGPSSWSTDFIYLGEGKFAIEYEDGGDYEVYMFSIDSENNITNTGMALLENVYDGYSVYLQGTDDGKLFAIREYHRLNSSDEGDWWAGGAYAVSVAQINADGSTTELFFKTASGSNEIRFLNLYSCGSDKYIFACQETAGESYSNHIDGQYMADSFAAEYEPPATIFNPGDFRLSLLSTDIYDLGNNSFYDRARDLEKLFNESIYGTDPISAFGNKAFMAGKNPLWSFGTPLSMTSNTIAQTDLLAMLTNSLAAKDALSAQSMFIDSNGNRINILAALANVLRNPTAEEKSIIEGISAILMDIKNMKDEETAQSPELKKAQDELIQAAAKILLAQAIPDLLRPGDMAVIKTAFSELNITRARLLAEYVEAAKPYYARIIKDIAANLQMLDINNMLSRQLAKDELERLPGNDIDKILQKIRAKQNKSKEEEYILRQEEAYQKEYLAPAAKRFEEGIRALVMNITKSISATLDSASRK